MDEEHILWHFLKPLAATHQGAHRLEDDVAYLSREKGQRWVVSSDTMVEGIHYLSSMAADDIGWRLLATSFSDLAASGASPKAYMLNLTFGNAAMTENWLSGFFAGLQEFSKVYDVYLLGGDTTMTTSNRMQVLGATVFGVVIEGMGKNTPAGLVVRGGAKNGDGIYTTGSIGDSALGLKMLLDEKARRLLHPPAQKKLVARYCRPFPRLEAGLRLATIANAMMDISDGLLLDAKRLLMASDVGGEIDLRCLPLSKEAEICCKRGIASRKELASAGDDYELLLTVSKENEDQISGIAKECTLDLTRIGQVKEGEGLRIFDDDGLEEYANLTGGYIHRL